MPQYILASPSIRALGIRLGLALFLWLGMCRAHEDGDGNGAPKGHHKIAVGGVKCPRSPQPSAATWVGLWHYDPASPAYPQAKINLD